MLYAPIVYVLTVMTWVGGDVTGGAIVSFYEFESQQSCGVARDQILTQAKSWMRPDKILAFCVSK